MKLRSPIVCAGISLAVLAGVYAIGCSEDETTEPAPDQTGSQPPDISDQAVDGDGPTPGPVFAVNKLYLGDQDRNGTVSVNAWKSFGYNLDHLVSDAGSTDLCMPVAGGSPSNVYPDGNDGIDNSFGKNILPIITGIASDAATEVNNGIEEGDFTVMLRVDTLGSGANYKDLPAQLYAGASMDNPPLWDGSDTWPVVPELLSCGASGDCSAPGAIDDSIIKFPTSYVSTVVETSKRTWVSGSKGNLDLSLSVAGYSLTLNIAQAVITMVVNEDNTEATEGIIAGAIETEKLIEELRSIAGSLDPSLCDGTTFDSIADQLRQASDIMVSGTHTPGVACDAISIGLGFDAKRVAMPDTIADFAEEGCDPCDPESCNTGGSGGSGGSGTGGSGGSGGSGTGGSGGGGGG